MIIILRWTDWLRDPHVERAASWADGNRYINALPNDQTAFVFDTRVPGGSHLTDDGRVVGDLDEGARGNPWRALDNYRGAKLAEIYKALGGDLASDRFTNYESGRRRTELLIEELAKKAPLVQPPLEDTMAKSTEDKKLRAFKKPKLGQFAPVRANTKLARILADMDGNYTLDELAAKHGLDRQKMSGILRHGLATMHGIGHYFADDKVTVIVPKGKTQEDLIKVTIAKERKPAGDGTRTQSKTKEAQAAAERGVAPPHLVITSEANKHRQKAVDRLEKLAADGDWDGVRAFRMNGIDTYSKMINRHRDLLLTAHNAQQGQEAAE